MEQKFVDRVMKDLKLSKPITDGKEMLARVYTAVLRAVQYEERQNDGKAFHLLEGTVRKYKGVYIFTPNKQLKHLFETQEKPYMLKIQESRFLELLKMALTEG